MSDDYGIKVLDENGNELYDMDGLIDTLQFLNEDFPGTQTWSNTVSQISQSPSQVAQIDFFLPRDGISVFATFNAEVQFYYTTTGSILPNVYIQFWLDNFDSYGIDQPTITTPFATIQLPRLNSKNWCPVSMVAISVLPFVTDDAFPGWHTAVATAYSDNYGGSGTVTFLSVRNPQIDVWQLGG